MFFLSCLTASSVMAQPTAKEWNAGIVGWNLGNQFECSAPGQDGESMAIGNPDGSIKAETAWGKPEAENLAVQNSYNQTFIDVVRATGGNNAKRHLIVQTYVCNPDFGLDGGLIVPTDAEGNGNDYMSVEFHYYTPWDYAGECKYNFWGEPYKDKGEASPSDEKTMADFLDKVVATWGSQGLGLVMGEWGVTDRQKAGQTDLIHENMTYYCRFLIRETLKRGISTFVWDNNSFGSGSEHFGIFARDKGMKLQADWTLKGIMEGKEK
ncbi:MAG: cellulase family glycosylhydrolase [Bacteroidaceae bacterium]|nr:cellulase family glycosylhydrolase [Bacteroidaceae bacterium]